MNALIIAPPSALDAGCAPGSTSALELPDPVKLLLADKRSEATKRAYQGDLADFFGCAPTPEMVRFFVLLPTAQIALRLAEYKARMLADGKAEATVNRRLSAVRALLKFCRRLGLGETDGRGLVDSERVQSYRDTRGIELKQMRRLLALPDVTTLGGKRDAALLRLLCENALRRGEVCALDVEDFEPATRTLRILGKGKGTQKTLVTISARVLGAITGYLLASGHTEGPLFRSLDVRADVRGMRLTTGGLYQIVGAYGEKIGVKLSPHRLRHSSITAALDATNGDMRKVQKLSRHKDIRTLTIYDDNREDMQGEVTDLLSKTLR